MTRTRPAVVVAAGVLVLVLLASVARGRSTDPRLCHEPRLLDSPTLADYGNTRAERKRYGRAVRQHDRFLRKCKHIIAAVPDGYLPGERIR